ncbi:MAG: ABC transporter substrate-binding protein [Treponema sp.]|jgi:multiple sugar transport system substrate-binding protein|nr:ABC transporter substrate-binding protein [Treponema sp.]
MKTKKTAGLAAVSLMVLSLLSCRGEKTPEGPVAIEYWYGVGGVIGETIETIIKNFNESQNEVRVTGVQQASYGETTQQLQAAIAAGQVPPAVMSGVSAVPVFARQNVLEPLEKYIEDTPGFNIQDFIPAHLAYCYNDNNELIALPVQGTTQILYYRTDTFNKDKGIDPDEAFKSWQNLAEASKKIVKRDANGETVFFGWDPMWGAASLITLAYSNGAREVSADGRTALLNTPEWIEPWESMRKWIHEDKIFKINFGGQGWEYWYKTIDDVLQGRTAGYTGSSGDQGDLDFSIVAAHIQPGYGGKPLNVVVDIVAAIIPKGAGQKQKEAGFKWLSYLTSPPMTAYYSMKTGYMAVRRSAAEDPAYQAYAAEHPQILVPLQQAEFGRKDFYDFTGGKINTALGDAADLVEIENIPAARALEEAQRIAQAALDEYWAEVDRNK